jgi:hypothetical protein
MNYFTHFETRKLDRAYDAYTKATFAAHPNGEFWKTHSYDDLFKGFCDEQGWEFVSDNRIGRIGRGDKNHKISCKIGIDGEGREYIFSAHSFCGSQKWTQGGRSGLALLGGVKECDCKKCNK